jgi:hypothetical protein
MTHSFVVTLFMSTLGTIKVTIETVDVDSCERARKLFSRYLEQIGGNPVIGECVEKEQSPC